MSAKYQPCSWDYTSLQTLLRQLSTVPILPVSQEQIERVRQQMYNQMTPLQKLEFIKAVDRLGLDYIFREDIHQILSVFSRDGVEEVIRCGLRSTSICFRLLRRFGFQVSEEIFNAFVDEKKAFMASLSEDVIGLLSLYEASDMAFNDEQMMATAKSFACTHLSEKKASCSLEHRALISDALSLPLHRRIPWIEARRFIDVYELQYGMNPELLLLAKHHFNALQSTHQKELSNVVSWWANLDLERSISFSRSRLVECFFYVVGITHLPEYGICREQLTKVGMLVAIIDDVYDIYGSLEELELFTEVVDRWDVNLMNELPNYMKSYFSVLIDTINEVEKHLPLADSIVAIPYIRRVWADLFKTFLVEVKWQKNGYIPTLKEYLSVATISISGSVILLYAYVLQDCGITTEMLQYFQGIPNIIRLPSLIFRLCNDLATNSVEQERGECPSSIQCYVNENGASEEEARQQISTIIDYAWKELNREMSFDLPIPRSFIDASLNLARVLRFMYHQGDGFSAPNHEIKASIMSLLLKNIKL